MMGRYRGNAFRLQEDVVHFWFGEEEIHGRKKIGADLSDRVCDTVRVLK